VTEPTVPWWGLLSATAAPVLLIGGWTVAAAQQRVRFDPVVETISALSARGATDRWIMTAALTGLGVCHLVTALALRPAATAGRLVLAGGGIATVLVAAFPIPVDGPAVVHVVSAATGFLLLAVWPVLAARQSPRAPAVLRTPVALPAAAVLLGLVVWFGYEFTHDYEDGLVGLSERAVAGAQAIWPLVTVALIRLAKTRARSRRRHR
jgi:hypothetical membrane protein